MRRHMTLFLQWKQEVGGGLNNTFATIILAIT